MKSLISIIAVILVVIMAFGAISSLTVSVASGGGGSSSTTATITTSSSGEVNSDLVINDLTIFYNSQDFLYSNPSYKRLAYYESGSCEDSVSGDLSNRIYIGCSQNNGEAMLAYGFSDLEIGKTYFISFLSQDSFFDYDELFFRYNNSDDFISFPMEINISGSIFLFTAKSSEFQLGVLHFPEMPSNESLSIHAEELKGDLIFSLNEVTE